MNPTRDQRPARPQKTIPDRVLEGILVLVPLALIIIYFASVPKFFSGDPRSNSAKSTLMTMSVVSGALQDFRLDCNRYPTTAEGLCALFAPPGHTKDWRGPYLKTAVLKDGWGNAYHYECPSSNGADSFLLESYGADGKPGGAGDAEDLIVGD